MAKQRSRYLIVCGDCSKRWYYLADGGSQYCPVCGSNRGTVKAREGPCKGRQVLVYTAPRQRSSAEVEADKQAATEQDKRKAREQAAERKQRKAKALIDRVEHIRDPQGQATYRFTVPSGTQNGTCYEVDASGCPLPRIRYVLRRALCSCPAGIAGSRGCSHVVAVDLRWRRELTESGTDVSPDTPSSIEPIGARTPADMDKREIEEELRYTGIEGERQTELLAEYGQRIRRQHVRATG